MDDTARYNQERWSALHRVDALFTRPYREMDGAQAAERVNADGYLGDLTGKHVLCLAGGGGQQSVAFALLGAHVTVVDLSAEQIERDREMAALYGFHFALHQGDMRDLSMLDSASFDVVFHPYSLNFVPDCRPVFAQVSRVIKLGGKYQFMCANPFSAGVRHTDWNGTGYAVNRPYVQGEHIEYTDEEWVYDQTQHSKIPPPVEYRQTLSTLVSSLTENGFILQQMHEVGAYDPGADAAPGSWEHFTSILPPWLVVHAVKNH